MADSTGKTYNEKTENIYKERNNAIVVLLVIIWLLTLLIGLFALNNLVDLFETNVIFSAWNMIIAPILIVISSWLMISCIRSIIRKRHCNINLGFCVVALSLLLLLCAYKTLYWSFAISFLYLAVGIFVSMLLSLIRFRIFVEKGKPTYQGNSVMELVVVILTIVVLVVFERNIGEFILIEPNEIGAIVMAILFSVGAVAMMSSGVRYFVLSDDRLLYAKYKNVRKGFSNTSIRRWF